MSALTDRIVNDPDNPDHDEPRVVVLVGGSGAALVGMLREDKKPAGRRRHYPTAVTTNLADPKAGWRAAPVELAEL